MEFLKLAVGAAAADGRIWRRKPFERVGLEEEGRDEAEIE